MEDNRRQFERVPVSLQIVVESLSGKRDCRITDLSMGGCYVDSIASMTTGEMLAFKISLPEGEWLHLTGNVAFVFPGCGFGIMFTPLTEGQQILLEQIIVANGGQQAMPLQNSAASTENRSAETSAAAAPEPDEKLFKMDRKNFSELTESIQSALEQAESERKLGIK
jgi:hypothetical protein